MDREFWEKDGEKSLLRSVHEDEKNVRLDRWLKRYFPGLSHSHLQKWLRKGLIRVDGRKTDSSERLPTGARIRVPKELFEDAAFERPRLVGARCVQDEAALLKSVVYEDADIVVLNKPAGLPVQAGTGVRENLDDSLMLLSVDGTTRPKLVHRLDKETSGVLLVARNAFSAAALAQSFRSRETTKIYWAVTRGVPEPKEGLIDAPLIKIGQSMHVAENEETEAKSAESLYKVVERAGNKIAFVALRPLSGRTHQLRVHLAHIGAPLLGDPLYGEKKRDDTLPWGDIGKGLHLHARRLIIPHPRGGILDVLAPLGKEMRKTWRFFGFDEKADVLLEDRARRGRKERK